MYLVADTSASAPSISILKVHGLENNIKCIFVDYVQLPPTPHRILYTARSLSTARINDQQNQRDLSDASGYEVSNQSPALLNGDPQMKANRRLVLHQCRFCGAQQRTPRLLHGLRVCSTSLPNPR